MSNDDYRDQLDNQPQGTHARRRDYFVLPAWAWPIIGLACVLAGLALGWALFRPKGAKTVEATATPVTIVVAAVATNTLALPTNTIVLPTDTLIPTAAPATATPTVLPTMTDTPSPTETPTIELAIAVGGQVQVVGVGRDQLRLRSGPGKDFVTFKMVDEGTILQVVGGPEQADDLTWWRLKDNLETFGWAAADFLQVVP